YVTVELFGDTFNIRPLKNMYVATALVGILAGALALGNYQAIWPVFGSANQLIAALMLIVATVYLMERARQCWFTAIPAVIMLITTMTALGFKTHRFFAVKDDALLGSISVLLIVLGLFVSARSAAVILRLSREGPDAADEGAAGDV
ncbi:MAG: carbon starvation CstA 5TM domain-containing protein, partial [Planctomycetota bacterium]